MHQYDLPFEHASMLRTLTGTPYEKPVPPKVEAQYWELKRCLDRLGEPMQTFMLATICCSLGYGKPTAEESAPPSILDLWKAKEIRSGARVEAIHRDKKREATLKRVTTRGEVIVQFEGDPAEIPLPADQVSVLEVAAT